jgi:outer membrane autotransporter protein
MIDASPGGGMQKVLDSVIALQSADAVAGGLEQLQPPAFTSLFTTGVFSQQRFGDALQSCRSRDGEFRFSAERECAWGRIAARDLSQDAKADTVGFDQRSYELSTGMQKAIGDQQHWFMGFGLGYEDSGLDAKPASEIDGQQLQAGAVLKGRFGATSLSLGLLGGIGDYDSSRQLLVVDPQAVASSQQDSSYYAGDLRFAYDFSGDRGYIRPQVSFGAGSMRIDGFRESGADAANLIVESQTHHFATLRPAVEIGGEFGQAGGTLWRPFARVGVTHFLDGNTQSVTARMEGAPEGVPPFVVTTEMDKTYTDVSLGLDVLRSAGLSLRIGYEGQFSGSTDQHSVQVKIWVGF